MSLYHRMPARVKDSLITKAAVAALKPSVKAASRVRWARAGETYATGWSEEATQPAAELEEPNDLETFFEARGATERMILKWRHYFEIYDRHLSKFVGKPTTLLEIGIAGGGSMDMWSAYLGPQCDRYGVDISPACKRFEDFSVFIGDQSDRSFWARFRSETPLFDIIIDDGGHHPVQQRITFEELLPRLRPGGVYICEDIHGSRNPFLAYAYGLSRELFEWTVTIDRENPERALSSPATAFQSAIHSVHLYPFVAVVERLRSPQAEFVCSKHGTERA
jgi:hypothetical protein